jgi:acyl dehydratase
MRTFTGIDDLRSAVGTHLGHSDWHVVTQDRIDRFAAATGDEQWIHVDPVRAAAGPFGTTIAHGYLTLSLVPMLAAEIYTVTGIRMGVNYGTDKVRFPAPVPVDTRIRAGAELLALTETPAGHQLRVRVEIEREAGGKPACVVEALSLVVP